MFNKYHLHLPHYFSKHPSRDLKELYWSVGLMNLAIAAVTLYEPVFLFTLGYSIAKIVGFYIMVYLGYALLLPFIGRLVGRIGYEHSIFYSQFFLIAYYISLFGISKFSWLFYVAPLFYAIQKSLYWPAYHADFTVFSTREQRGREVSGIESLNMLMYIVGPFIGGAILEWTNFASLFVVVALIFVLSTIPLLRIKEVHSPVDFSYLDVFRKLADKQHRRSFFAYLGFGEELIVLSFWPIFIYLVVEDYLKMGTVVAFATLVTSFLILFIGRAVDRYKKEHILRGGSILYSFSFLIRGFARNAWALFGLDTFSRFAKEVLFVPLIAITYDRARRSNVLAHIVFFEQSIAVAKLLTGLLLLVVLHFFAVPWVPIFILASILSLAYLFLRE